MLIHWIMHIIKFECLRQALKSDIFKKESRKKTLKTQELEDST